MEYVYSEEEFMRYEAEIDRSVNFLVSEEEKEKGYNTLKQMLRNYDRMTKSGNMLEFYKMPYWTIGCFMGSKKEDNNETI